ncbi:MAG TPA: hypothetical protein VML95_02065 [Longimicrobiales bacterium]|nr:hypothetical protein [Longimicrobiales bacterium]
MTLIPGPPPETTHSAVPPVTSGVQPVFEPKGEGPRVHLAKDLEAIVDAGGDEYVGSASVVAPLFGQPGPMVTVDFGDWIPEEAFSALAVETEWRIRIPSLRQDFPAFQVGFGLSPRPACIRFRPRPFDVVARYSDRPATRLVFHPLNMPAFSWPDDRGRQRTVHLEAGEWRIRLTSLLPGDPETGTFALSAAVEATRTDGGQFDLEEGRQITDAVGFLLGFATGSWRTPMFPVGFDAAGERTWEIWTTARQPSWTRREGPMPLLDARFLELLAPGYFAFRAQGETESYAIERAIEWQLAANVAEIGVQGPVVVAQAALELLAWTTLVQRVGMTKEGFEKLPAADKIRLLFADLDLPTAIPTTERTQGLVSLAAEHGWVDGPHCLTAIRNAYVHPKIERQRALRGRMHGARDLALWYVEMCILALCGYRKEYRSRVERLAPWESIIMPGPA